MRASLDAPSSTTKLNVAQVFYILKGKSKYILINIAGLTETHIPYVADAIKKISQP